ncbi:MAG: DUF3618 domain-containing protein [Micropruina sp.]|uniref:DUF3618 domain-containing protein n=1 Tax=Micropruina sp. TaxID=2737536 RepID=UPI0039E3CEF5
MADTTTRSKQDIEAEIAAARERLASNVAGLVNEVHPKAVMQRGIDEARGFAATEFANAKAQVIDENGRLRTERVLLVGGAVAGVVTFVLLVRGILKGLRQG